MPAAILHVESREEQRDAGWNHENSGDVRRARQRSQARVHRTGRSVGYPGRAAARLQRFVAVLRASPDAPAGIAARLRRVAARAWRQRSSVRRLHAAGLRRGSRSVHGGARASTRGHRRPLDGRDRRPALCDRLSAARPRTRAGRRVPADARQPRGPWSVGLGRLEARRSGRSGFRARVPAEHDRTTRPARGARGGHPRKPESACSRVERSAAALPGPRFSTELEAITCRTLTCGAAETPSRR